MSRGKSRILRWAWKVDRPMPGRSMEMRRILSAVAGDARMAASRREEGVPWK